MPSRCLQSPLVNLLGLDQLALVGVEGPQVVDRVKRRRGLSSTTAQAYSGLLARQSGLFKAEHDEVQ
jgi:hypothetical protein